MKLSDLLPVAIVFVVATVAITVGADILTEINADQTANSYADNVSTAGLQGLDELGSWVPTLALVVAAAIVIGILIYSFAFRR